MATEGTTDTPSPSPEQQEINTAINVGEAGPADAPRSDGGDVADGGLGAKRDVDAPLEQRASQTAHMPGAGGATSAHEAPGNPMTGQSSEFGVQNEDGPEGSAKRLEHVGGGAIDAELHDEQ